MSLSGLRAALADELTEAGIDTYPYDPEVFSPPGALVYPGTPFMEAGEVFGEMVVRFVLYVLVDVGQDEELDRLVTLAIATLVDYDVEEIVIAPQIDERSVISGARITLTTEVARKELFE